MLSKKSSEALHKKGAGKRTEQNLPQRHQQVSSVESQSQQSELYTRKTRRCGTCQTVESPSLAYPREGLWKGYFRLRNSGYMVNNKRLHRGVQKHGRPLTRIKKRLSLRIMEPIVIPEVFTHIWSIDFMSGALHNTRKFRSFNVIDDYNREVLFIEIDYSLKSIMVVWKLRNLVSRYGKPKG